MLTSEAELNPSAVEFSTTAATTRAVRSMSKYEHAFTGISPVMCGPTFAQAIKEQVSISGVASRPRKSVVSATDLAYRWMIGLSTVQKNFAGTMQLSVRTGEGSIHQRFKDTLMAHRYKRLAITFYTDTLFAKEYSCTDHKVALAYANAFCDFVFVVPLPTSQSD